jgi:hypothetical protein
MKDLKELGGLLFGFIPWLLFLFISGHSLISLERALIVCLIVAVIFGFGDLRRGYILSWGTVLFFGACVVLVNIFKVVWVASYMDLLSNLMLAGIMWISIMVGMPFALQYARKDLPKEQWNDPKFIQGCRWITLVWAYLMSLSVLVSIIRRSPALHFPGWVYFDTTILIIVTGLTITTLFKRQKRLQREKVQPPG